VILKYPEISQKILSSLQRLLPSKVFISSNRTNQDNSNLTNRALHLHSQACHKCLRIILRLVIRDPSHFMGSTTTEVPESSIGDGALDLVLLVLVTAPRNSAWLPALLCAAEILQLLVSDPSYAAGFSAAMARHRHEAAPGTLESHVNFIFNLTSIILILYLRIDFIGSSRNGE
jgi:hypothetical protein